MSQKSSDKLLSIIAVGCSAGGLDALKKLFGACPEKLAAGFVVLQHMGAAHKTQLPEILSRTCTSLKFKIASDQDRILPGVVYVVPPSKGALIKDGCITLTDRTKEKPKTPHTINDLFFSLAKDQGSSAVGIILSGAGSDGVVGLSSIREHGGIGFAQDCSAQFDGMPESAAQAGAVDFILPPERILPEALRIITQLKRHDSDFNSLGFEQPELAALFAILKARSGVNFSSYRSGTIYRRLAKRLALLDIKRPADYLELLKSKPEEVDALYRDLLINVTSFFRDGISFGALSETVFPQILKQGAKVRIWVPACASGEEAYSIAISAFEYLAANKISASFVIFATDIDDEALQQARDGRYSPLSVDSLDPALRVKYFDSSADNYQVKKELRDVCIFARQDVTTDPPFSNLDFISCRNLFIYFSESLQARVLRIFHYALKPSRYLFLGASESIRAEGVDFSPVLKEHRLFIRGTSPTNRLELSSHVWDKKLGWKSLVQTTDAFKTKDLRTEITELVTQHIPWARIVVNDQLKVMFTEGPVDQYLQFPSGSANLNLMNLAKAGLGLELRAGVLKAATSQTTIIRNSVVMATSDVHVTIDIEIIPFRSESTGDQLFLILLKQSDQQLQPSPLDETKTVEYRQVEQELIATREFLQSVVGQHEAIAEELKSANEEIIARNEELQSTNEELETTKEELQAGNEELSTLNEELTSRNQELNQLYSTIRDSEEKYRALSQSATDAIITADADSNITFWNPAAEAIFGFSASEVVGKSLSIIIPERYRLAHNAGMKRVVKGAPPRIIGKTVEIEALHKDGIEFPVELSLSAWQLNGVKYFTAIIRDASVKVWSRRLQLARLEISKTVNSADSTESVVMHSLRILCQQLGYTVGEFWEFSPSKQALTFHCMWPAASEEFKELANINKMVQFRPGEGLPGICWQKGPVWLEDVQTDERFIRKEQFKTLPLHSAALFPVGTGSDFFGVVELFSPTTVKPEPSLLVLLDEIGGYIHNFLKRKQSEEQQKSFAVQLELEVEERTRALTTSEAKYRFIAEAGALLSSSNDYYKTLQDLADLCVPKVADWCVVNLFDTEENVDQIAVSHQDTSKVELAKKLAVEFPPHPDETYGTMQVKRTGKSEIIENIPDGVMEQAARSPEHLTVLKSLGLKSYICVPMLVRDEVLGVLAVVYSESNRRYSRDDLFLLEEVARRAALAIDRSRLLHEAQKANRAKDEFLATLSHELRTPMNIILGWVEILREERDEATVSKALEMLDRNSHIQIKLINDLLDISRIISGKLPIEISTIDINRLSHDVVENLKPAAEQKKIVLNFQSDVSNAPVRGDSVRLQQVLQNLINNALKFTPAGGSVDVSVRPHSSGVAISVIDNGIGINKDFLPQVFESFRQEDGSSTRQHGGLGLGLAISKFLMAQHNGRIEVESKGKDKGSTFTMILPLANAKAIGKKDIDIEVSKNLFSSRPLSNYRILVVDDSQDILELLKRKLTKWGATVNIAGSADEAETTIFKTKFDLLICDIGMPKRDGLQLIQDLRKKGIKIPAIALTAYARTEEVSNAISAGFDQHLAKPVSEDVLLQAIVSELKSTTQVIL